MKKENPTKDKAKPIYCEQMGRGSLFPDRMRGNFWLLVMARGVAKKRASLKTSMGHEVRGLYHTEHTDRFVG